jgi:predicted RNase H-like HicB family nuclease
MKRPSHRVVARRSGKWWALEAPDIPGAYSQVKRLDHAESMMREALALLLDVDENSFDVDLEVHLSDGLDRVIEELSSRRERVEQDVHDVFEEQADLARRLVNKHALSVRDSGWLLGLSHQRISQLVK